MLQQHYVSYPSVKDVSYSSGETVTDRTTGNFIFDRVASYPAWLLPQNCVLSDTDIQFDLAKPDYTTEEMQQSNATTTAELAVGEELGDWLYSSGTFTSSKKILFCYFVTTDLHLKF